METRKYIQDLETLKVLSDPLRVQIVEAIRNINARGELATVKQLAERFDRSPKKLYYHVNLLENYDLIMVADTRMVSGIVEKLYQVSAQSFIVDTNIFTSQADNQEQADSMVTMISSLLETTKQEVVDLARSDSDEQTNNDASKPNSHIFKDYAYLTPNQIQHFKQRLQEISDEFDATGADQGQQGTYYSLMTTFFPVVNEQAATKD